MRERRIVKDKKRTRKRKGRRRERRTDKDMRGIERGREMKEIWRWSGMEWLSEGKKKRMIEKKKMERKEK